MSDHPNRLLIFLGGICGALGVALSAVAAHRGGGNVQTAATLLLAHAPALLAAGMLAGRMAGLGGAVLVVGLVLFCGDMVSRDLADDRLFAFAAPAGGTALIAGWLLIALSAFSRRW